MLYNPLLEGNKKAENLYNAYAKHLPIIDYHNHLNPMLIAKNEKFSNITEAWLSGDHYKWRAMRALGVSEHYITGEAHSFEKFKAYAKVLPLTVGNPLYSWSRMELATYFGIQEPLNEQNAERIYHHCNELLQQEGYGALDLLKKQQVQLLCTTDDPCDNLEWHKALAGQENTLQMLPTFRPDRVFDTQNLETWNAYIQSLGEVCAFQIRNLNNLLLALRNRVDYFHNLGCRLADHGLECLPSVAANEAEARLIFDKARAHFPLSTLQQERFIGFLLSYLATVYHEMGWVQQFHLGALRNTNARGLLLNGKDSGYDSLGDFPQAAGLQFMLNGLNSKGVLAKTILYNLNPKDNALFASMAGNFQDGTAKGRVQYGAAWWFLDQKNGIQEHLKTLSSFGCLSQFVGMLTDSRSFLSFPRHDYFRRLLCVFLAEEMNAGEMPSESSFVQALVESICYRNAREWFGFSFKDVK